MDTVQSTGQVYLVGAGPGDPGLITLAAVECLRKADVILYDYLANPRLLEYAPATAATVCLGQHGKHKLWTQREINEALVRYAGEGKTVVRLKGGDPAVFARGAEEAEVLAEAGISFQIVPGITVALAAGSCAGIPVTHRDMASAVALVTGQERLGKEGTMDVEALARFPGTLVLYMGVTTAPQWTASLIAAGKPADTPAAVIRHCSLPDQQVIICELGNVADQLRQHHLRPPVIVILGPVVNLAPSLNWFERRPLFGQRILITRPRHQCAALRQPLEELGAEVLVHPAIEIAPANDWDSVNEALQRLTEFDWLVFSSSNGVRFTLQRLLDLGLDLRQLGHLRLACVGPATARELAKFHLRCDLQPVVYEAEALADELVTQAGGKRFLLARASRGRDVLREKLTAADSRVTEIVVYESRDVAQADREILEALDAGAIHWVTVTSSAIAYSLVRLFGEALRQAQLVSISPITTATLQKLGFPPAVEAEHYTMAGVVAAIRASS